ncbi:Histidine kinase [Roseovarius sp. EC-HK134]|jgi:hypothetical protein|uniref:Histidine kinase n=1 Tax=Roseovarius mucosus TaxID=215743 RepID=A0A1V0RTM5_9RHOB|nr:MULTISPECIES: DUF6446 family protein [Roseovarius]MBS4010110.1 histidine kinase [Roseovarius sp.]ARE85099.1 histidine kinase [Roseovarius mucosus]MBW4974369.1 histidine kinase [Roseovarius mucosus]VVT33708.1 Histidine kinase [Roseovarius sp. EC-SD190]VVT33710.1 Histidine kinase [Roseovarius sp. EC-HK134]|tara:strand:+ start:1477 stop:2001 length:525 start_codon:yes stop_codon:yes gene_type:complete
MGKILAGAILISALVAGAAMYYLQVYHFYEEVAADGTNDVVLTSLVTGAPEPVLYDNFTAIDANSSPIRYRACFTTAMSHAMLTETYELYERAEPLTAPDWFDCYDAQAIGLALEEGRALAFLGQRDVIYGVDRVVAITEDGRGYAWHQINRCGEVVFDGQPAPDDCPEPPQGY